MGVASAALLTSPVQAGLTGRTSPSSGKSYFPAYQSLVQESYQSSPGFAEGVESSADPSSAQFLAQVIAQFLQQEQSPSLALPYEKLVEYSEIKFKPSNAGRPLGLGKETFAPEVQDIAVPEVQSSVDTVDASQPSAGFLSGIASYNATLTRNSTLPVTIGTPETVVSLPIFA